NGDEDHGPVAQQRRHAPWPAGRPARRACIGSTVRSRSQMSRPKRDTSRQLSPLTQEQREERRAFALAVTIHALLFVFMLVGFVSSPTTPQPVQVELWMDGVSPTARPEEPVVEETEEDPEPEPTP